MITLDRDSATPIYEQLAQQLRFLIATGHYRGRRTLPSTRSLGRMLGISFHTVRKAYQQLETEGVLRAQAGSGYRVHDPSPLKTSERIEQGATIVEEMLHRLAGLGLGPSDIEYLVGEQLTGMRLDAASPKIVFVSPSAEVAAQCAEDISGYIQRPIEPVALAHLSRHRDAEYALAEFRHLTVVRESLPRCDALGVATHLSTRALDRLSHMLPSKTVGLLTADAETVRYVTERVKYETSFGGQILATTASASLEEMTAFSESVDLLVYMPALARRVRRLGGTVPSVEISVGADEASKREVLEVLPE